MDSKNINKSLRTPEKIIVATIATEPINNNVLCRLINEEARKNGTESNTP